MNIGGKSIRHVHLLNQSVTRHDSPRYAWLSAAETSLAPYLTRFFHQLVRFPILTKPKTFKTYLCLSFEESFIWSAQKIFVWALKESFIWLAQKNEFSNFRNSKKWATFETQKNGLSHWSRFCRGLAARLQVPVESARTSELQRKLNFEGLVGV